MAVEASEYDINACYACVGAPHRKSLLNNKWMCGTVVICTVVSIYVIIYPANFMISFLNMKPSPVLEYRLLIFALSLLCCCLCALWEHWIVDKVSRVYSLRARARPTVALCSPAAGALRQRAIDGRVWTQSATTL